jgi:dolichol-phosphate mannosyltransferase
MRLRDTISFVIPVYNEEENLRPLLAELSPIAEGVCDEYEVIFVDDLSTDASLSVMRDLAAENGRVKFISLDIHAGQSAALYHGFQNASGNTIITMDADLQNDPSDIPRMLDSYGEYDMVTGWRHNRHDTFQKRVGSKIGNGVRNLLTWENIHDTGCSLKIMRASMLKQIKMFRGLHRFLPTLMRLEGARVLEIKVNHRPRTRGISNYTNVKRGMEGLYDVIAVRWMIKRHIKAGIKEKRL